MLSHSRKLGKRHSRGAAHNLGGTGNVGLVRSQHLRELRMDLAIAHAR
jgi:hypothetical protein